MKNKTINNLEELKKYHELGKIPQPLKTFEYGQNEAIKEFCKGEAGIYYIYNKVTGMWYIGSAGPDKLYTRYRDHFYGKIERTNKNLHAARIEYGPENFTFSILAFVNPEIRYEAEEYCLSLYSPAFRYNVNTKASGAPAGYYKHSADTLEKMKEVYTPEKRAEHSKINAGTAHSQINREKISEGMSKKYAKDREAGIIHSSVVNKTAARKTYTYDENKNFVKQYDSLKEFYTEMGISVAPAVDYVQKEKIFKKGGVFVSYDSPEIYGKPKAPVESLKSKGIEFDKSPHLHYAVYDSDRKLYKQYPSLNSISTDLKINEKSIIRIIRNKEFYTRPGYNIYITKYDNSDINKDN